MVLCDLEILGAGAVLYGAVCMYVCLYMCDTAGETDFTILYVEGGRRDGRGGCKEGNFGVELVVSKWWLSLRFGMIHGTGTSTVASMGVGGFMFLMGVMG